MVHLIDRAVGRVLDALRESGEYDDTIVVFTSDHGDFLGDHGLIFKTELCSHSLVHVPFVLKAPGIGRGTHCYATMSNTDVLPTLCELAHIPVPSGVQGASALPLLAREEEAFGSICCSPEPSNAGSGFTTAGSSSQTLCGEPGRARGTSGRTALVQCYHEEADSHNITVYDDMYRFTWYPSTDERELYDHRYDPHELVNLAGDRTVRDEEERLFLTLLTLHARTDRPSAGRIGGW